MIAPLGEAAEMASHGRGLGEGAGDGVAREVAGGGGPGMASHSPSPCGRGLGEGAGQRLPIALLKAVHTEPTKGTLSATKVPRLVKTLDQAGHWPWPNAGHGASPPRCQMPIVACSVTIARTI